MKFEYMILQPQFPNVREEYTRELNELGKQGWECFHVLWWPVDGYRFYLKRTVKNE